MTIDKTAFYTCSGKGGRYRIISISKGAGSEKGKSFITYMCNITEDTYTRTSDNFKERMEKCL